MLMEKIKEDLKSIVSIKSVHSKFLAYESACLMWGATAIATAGDVLLVAAGNVLLWLLNYIGAAVDVVAPSSRIWVQGERRAYPDETRAIQDTKLPCGISSTRWWALSTEKIYQLEFIIFYILHKL